jgi:hypothetical protein
MPVRAAGVGEMDEPVRRSEILGELSRHTQQTRKPSQKIFAELLI